MAAEVFADSDPDRRSASSLDSPHQHRHRPRHHHHHHRRRLLVHYLNHLNSSKQLQQQFSALFPLQAAGRSSKLKAIFCPNDNDLNALQQHQRRRRRRIPNIAKNNGLLSTPSCPPGRPLLFLLASLYWPRQAKRPDL